AYMNGGVESIGNKVHPLFGTIFAICIYASIGALYGIPRAANVAYEIGTRNVLPVHNQFTLIIFSAVFFLIVYLIALYPNRILVIINPEGSIGESGGDFAQTPLISGVLEGYFTMDLVAALAFSVVIVQSFKLNGVNNQKLLVKNVVKAGFISAILLLIIYFAL